MQPTPPGDPASTVASIYGYNAPSAGRGPLLEGQIWMLSNEFDLDDAVTRSGDVLRSRVVEVLKLFEHKSYSDEPVLVLCIPHDFDLNSKSDMGVLVYQLSRRQITDMFDLVTGPFVVDVNAVMSAAKTRQERDEAALLSVLDVEGTDAAGVLDAMLSNDQTTRDDRTVESLRKSWLDGPVYHYDGSLVDDKEWELRPLASRDDDIPIGDIFYD